jgi:lipoic acid synthetase
MTRERHSAGFPPWLKTRIPAGTSAARVRETLSDLRLNTVCNSALCPNIGECFHCGTATFLIMGPNCTRSCSFCAVDKGPAAPLQADEPERVAEAARRLSLRHVVITSVTRDDIADGGAAHFAATIRAVRGALPGAAVEVLVPDFAGSRDAVAEVVAARPDVFNHNVETVPRLYPAVRPEADYARSLEVLRIAGELSPALVTKSGMMAGLGEALDEVEGVFRDLRGAGVRIVTVGQYLRPSKKHIPVERFVTPEEFAALERTAIEMGLEAASCAPLVRSSYHAGEVFRSGGRR